MRKCSFLFSDTDPRVCPAPQDQKSPAESTHQHNSATEEGNGGKVDHGIGGRTFVETCVTELIHQGVAGDADDPTEQRWLAHANRHVASWREGRRSQEL